MDDDDDYHYYYYWRRMKNDKSKINTNIEIVQVYYNACAWAPVAATIEISKRVFVQWKQVQIFKWLYYYYVMFIDSCWMLFKMWNINCKCEKWMFRFCLCFAHIWSAVVWAQRVRCRLHISYVRLSDITGCRWNSFLSCQQNVGGFFDLFFVFFFFSFWNQLKITKSQSYFLLNPTVFFKLARSRDSIAFT